MSGPDQEIYLEDPEDLEISPSENPEIYNDYAQEKYDEDFAELDAERQKKVAERINAEHLLGTRDTGVRAPVTRLLEAQSGTD